MKIKRLNFNTTKGRNKQWKVKPRQETVKRNPVRTNIHLIPPLP